MKLVRILWLAVMLGLSSGQVNGQSMLGFTKKYHTFQGTTIPYYTFIPAAYDSAYAYPLVLCLHGAGERGDDSTVVMMNSIAVVWTYEANQVKWPCIVVVPQCPALVWWSDEVMLLTVSDLLDSLLTRFRIDTNRIYVTGLSMGGSGTWDLAIRHPNRFAAVVPMSGRGDPLKASDIRRLPIWAFHGEADPVLPVTGSRMIVAAIEKTGVSALYAAGLPDSALAYEIRTGASLLYTEYPNGGHAIWDIAYHHPLLLPWVFSQSRAITDMLTYTRNVQVGPLTARRNQDTVTIRATVDNPSAHPLIVTALVTDLGGGSMQESLRLLDDGMHSDKLPNDGLWGGILVPDMEGVYSVSVKAVDPSVTRPSILLNTAFFTTAGPIVIDGVEVTTVDTSANPGDALRYRISLRNLGSTYTVKSVTATVICPDTAVTIMSNVIPYGDLAPGQLSPGSGLQTIRYKATRPGNYLVPLTVEISSGGVVFWTDRFVEEITGVEQVEQDFPKDLVLQQNYPNPFNPSTTIRYGLPQRSQVTLSVFNTLGQQVAVLQNGEQEAGFHEVTFDGSGLSSGVYFYRLRAGDFMESKLFLLLR